MFAGLGCGAAGLGCGAAGLGWAVAPPDWADRIFRSGLAEREGNLRIRRKSSSLRSGYGKCPSFVDPARPEDTRILRRRR